MRELVQNADDARAGILVLRFEPDALYVANDGRAFTTRSDLELGDFERISLILKRHQAEDKETTGHFGSGFQTVYALTNAPEIHSNARSGSMDPVAKRWEYFSPGDPRRLVSPYVWKRDMKGVIFRFPWRDARRGEERAADGTSPFSDPHDWPRWTKNEQRKMYEDLQGYVHQVLLCCKNLQCIRLIWADETPESYQAERDFGLDDTPPGSKVVTLSEGAGGSSKGWFAWDDRRNQDRARGWASFQIDGWRWRKGPIRFEYLLCSGRVKDGQDRELSIGKKPDGQVVITNQASALSRILRRNDVQLLLPLFDTNAGPGGGGNAFLYSTIPLPRRGGNSFAFTGHFFPEEGRKDVAVTSLGGKSGEWHREIVRTVARLYLDFVETYVGEVHRKDLPEADQQRILLNAIPGLPPAEWMRPGKEAGATWANDLPGRIALRLLGLPILWTGARWEKPNGAFWARQGDGVDSDGTDILRLMGRPALTKEFVQHPHVTLSLREELGKRELTPLKFGLLLKEFLFENGGADGKVRMGQPLKKGGKLDVDSVNSLIDYCVVRSTAGEASHSASIVPGEDGVLRPLAWYRLIPPPFAALLEILPSELKVHPHFETRLAEIDAASRLLGADDTVRILAKVADAEPTRFNRLSKKTHQAVSKILIAMAEDTNFALKPSFVGLRFIPYRQENQVGLGAPNATRSEDGTMDVFMDTRPENYERAFIYASATDSVPGLTKEVAQKIRFLDVLDATPKTVEKLVKKLYLKPLQDGSIPTNFVRHFLSDAHGSLFRDQELARFLNIPVDSPELPSQKKAFLDALRGYYHPERLEGRVEGRVGRTERWLTPTDMGEVPCLYDASGEWHPARSFAIEMRRDIAVLQYRALGPDLLKWPPETLLALGVAQRPESKQIVEVVTRLARNPDENRRELADITALVLLSGEPWEDRLHELDDLRWIPVTDGGFRMARDAMLKAPEIELVLGPDFPAFFDTGSCSQDLRESVQKAIGSADETGAKLRNRAKELGVQVEPSLEVMLNRVSEFVTQVRAPPPKLFVSLSERIEAERAKPAAEGHYFGNGSWWPGRKVFLSTDESLAAIMGQSYILVSPIDIAHELGYLRYIGAREAPNPSDILERIVELCSNLRLGTNIEYLTMRSAWDILDRRVSPADLEALKRYRNMLVYPTPDGLVAPASIVFLGEDRPASRQLIAGRCGDVYLLRVPDCPHTASLRILGARDEARLDAHEILGILKSLVRSHQVPVRISDIEAATKLLSMIAQRHFFESLTQESIWPSRNGGTFSFENIKSVYVRDHPAAKYFEDQIPLLFDVVGGTVLPEVRRLALRQRESRPFSKALKSEPLIPTERKPDVDGTKRIRLIAEALKLAFPVASYSKPDSIGWLALASMIEVDSLFVRLTVERHSKVVPTACFREPGEPVVLFRLGGHPDLYDDLTNEIVRECRARGLPETQPPVSQSDVQADSGETSRGDDFAFTVSRLLTRNPHEWGSFIEGVVVPDEWIPPLMDPDAEVRPGYLLVRSKLREIYGYCQACGRRTPAGEMAGDTCEKVRSVVSMKGGRYKGELTEYQLHNSVFLCPSHSTLFERGLVKILPLEDGVLEGQERAAALRKMADEWPADVSGMGIEVFEAVDRDSEPSWKSMTMELTADHARGMLRWLATWIEGG